MKKSLALLTTALIAVGSVQAAGVTSNVVSYTNSASDFTDWDAKVISLPKFNAALGTLASVSFNLYGEMTTTFIVANTSGIAGSLTYSASGSLGPLQPPLAALQILFSQQSGQVGVAAGPSVNPAFFFSGTGDLTLTDDLGAFIGSGQFDTPIGAFASTTMDYDFEGDVGPETFARADLSVIYAYAPNDSAVPEPASLALVGLALAACGMAAQRRR